MRTDNGFAVVAHISSRLLAGTTKRSLSLLTLSWSKNGATITLSNAFFNWRFYPGSGVKLPALTSWRFRRLGDSHHRTAQDNGSIYGTGCKVPYVERTQGPVAKRCRNRCRRYPGTAQTVRLTQYPSPDHQSNWQGENSTPC